MATGSKAQKKAAEREARQAAEEEARQRRQREQRRRAVLIYGSIAAAAVVIAGGVLWSALRPKPGLPVAGQGRTHIALGAPHPPYNSNPPTSGWMTDQTAPWGMHTTRFPDETLVHNLEHGGIWVSYKNSEDEALMDSLVALAREFPRKLIITHRPENESRIAVAAWQRVMNLDTYDKDTIVAFIQAHRNRAPERMMD